ncbi:HEAT repeat domain-containing protein [Cystobacter fuscus]|uniref:HEAT repeat domain-containing protein n=1 Tax=Cystobacter fuscus TaxID=43 RepID=UPI002B2DAF12|nr:HEAT repeat domain-containing protein [Cystobacter fuscus]
MAQREEATQWQKALIEAFHAGDEARARAQVTQFGARKAKPVLEAMLENPDAAVRQAAAFGLSELGGAASVKLLEHQLALEEARGNHDGAAVAEAITQALGRIQGASARASLARRLERLIASDRPEPADLNDVACALWRKRHPELIPIVRQSLEKLAHPAPTALHGLLVLLEKPPTELRHWAADNTVPIELKGEVLTLLTEELPETLVSTLPAFISSAESLMDTAVKHKGPASAYCVELFSLLLLKPEHLFPMLPEVALNRLRDMARKWVAATSSLKCSLQAAVLLKHLGHPEDAALLEAHRPADPTLAKVFDDAARALHG